MASDLLFELGTEELPSGAVWSLADKLADNIVAELDKAQLSYGRVRRFATPRRLAVLIEALDEMSPSQTTMKRGPARSVGVDAEGLPSKALLGFAKSLDVGLDALQILKTDKGEWWGYEAVTPGANTVQLLPELINTALSNLALVKPMKWGDGDIEFARPVHWAVLLFGKQCVLASVLGVQTGRNSTGHRFHHPEKIAISHPNQYEKLLEDARVVADFHKRRQIIVEQVNALAKGRGLQALMPSALLDEVCSIVEWPSALLVNFQKEFLEVPQEALIAAMQSHQKSFALCDAEGQLQPYFITVANIVSQNPQSVVSGNEKVMHARLSDAAFFYKMDKKKALAEFEPATAKVVFQARLGSLQDKARRMQVLMEFLSPALNLDLTKARYAAFLSKCDLMTTMVGEFPELQGLMGCYYALNDGELPEIATALNEQYLPKFSGDSLPEHSLGLALSLADRIDTLVGIFAIGQKPRGVKDPFKLRRHALALVRLLIATPAKINLSSLIQASWDAYGAQIENAQNPLDDLYEFVFERLQSFYLAKGISADFVHAVRACQSDWLYDVDQRINALRHFTELSPAKSLSAACKRVNNLLASAPNGIDGQKIKPEWFVEKAEKTLFSEIDAMDKLLKPLYATGDYMAILHQLAELRASVDDFFDQVMVMAIDEDVRDNRLSILSRLQGLLQGVADISLLTTLHE